MTTPPPPDATVLEVDRGDLRRTRLAASRAPAVPPAGAVLCRVDSFAMTANTVTYAVAGDLFGYWRFFPASGPPWGRVPAWGHGEVVASSHPDVEPGQRFYGFWPMADHVLLEPTGVGAQGFVDGAAHRAELPPIYSRYQRVDPRGGADAEARTALLRPLFATSFLLDAWLGEHDLFGADAVVVSSASSKTALGLGHLLRERGRGEVVGLTSRRHVDFVARSGGFDRAIPYDDLPDALPDAPTVFVDVAGDAGVLAAVHERLAPRLRRSVRVGFTHHDVLADGSGDLPGPAPEMFFAPDHVQRLAARWGGAAFAERLEVARLGFERGPAATIELVRRTGPEEVAAAWLETVEGRTDPATGTICAW